MLFPSPPLPVRFKSSFVAERRDVWQAQPSIFSDHWRVGCCFPEGEIYISVPYLQLSSQRDALFHAAQIFLLARSCGKLTDRTLQDATVIRTNVHSIFNLFLILQKNLHPFIQSLIDLISESFLQWHWNFTFLVHSGHLKAPFSPLPQVGFPLPGCSILRAPWYSGSKVDNGQQSNFTAPASDRHRVILGGTPLDPALCISSRTLWT